ncbi:MAG TPA: YajQ family cyclic di-GMP-binding protein [Bacteroidetes bacterium]|nr:MAG: YajQ family cyclic di-GMP-binding protein [Ignavibacteria bacterium GWA2_54_16]HCA78307.1 YajQ family cyclic di-GMP-binding protein [Bacteroidota bacterium]
MAQQNSFDIVSEVDLQEVDNALNQARKEISQRYDFKDSKTLIEYNQKEKHISIHTSDEFHLKSAVDVVQSKLVKRGISLKALRYGTIESAANSTVRQLITLIIGIDKDDARAVVKLIKDSRIRVQAQIMDDQVRVTGKDKDDLQSVIKLVREADLSFPVQFVNYR